MLHLFDLLARLFLAGFEPFWVSAGPAAFLAVVGVVGLSAVAVALCARYLTSIAASLPVTAQLRQPREPADIAELLSQSNPDAEGRARPRAPSLSLAVA